MHISSSCICEVPKTDNILVIIMSHITLEHVYITFPGFKGSDVRSSSNGFNALSDISLSINSGDRVGLVGKNGSGKSALLRVMAGIYPPTNGRLEVEGKISSLFNMGLGMQMEHSGIRNIYLSNLINDVKDKDQASVVADIATFTELGDFLNNSVRTYSSGMGMRLKFACATAVQPDILLLDEWIGAGDTEFQSKATDRMNELVDSAGIVVLATHNIHLMKKICNKGIWLDEGSILKAGSIDEVLEARNKFMFPEKYF